MTIDLAKIELRPARSEDYEFARQVCQVTMRNYVEQAFGWDQAVQDANFDERFIPAEGRIIYWQETRIGWMQVQDEPDAYNLGQLYIMPEFQGQGIGSEILKRFLKEATQKGKPATLGVMKINPARGLYERHGFKIIGENDYKFFMRKELTL